MAAKRLVFDVLLGEASLADVALRAQACALLLLPFVRAMINAPIPRHLILVPGVSSEKTYLAALCIRPFGHVTPTTEKGNEEEWRRSILAKLVSGPTHVFIDNIKHNLNSPALDEAITSPDGFIEDRLTGTGINARVAAWCTWVATANNPTVTADIASRSVVRGPVPRPRHKDVQDGRLR